MPSKKFLLMNLGIATVGISAFLLVTNKINQETEYATDPTNGTEVALPPSPQLKAFIPDPSRCPSLMPRTVTQNGPGWRIITDRSLCVIAEYPDGWDVQSAPAGISFMEPLKSNQGETAFPGELSAEVHVRFFTGPWTGEKVRALVKEEATPMHAHVAAYRIHIPDGTLVTVNAHAPENDAARETLVRAIVRGIVLHGPEEKLSLSTYVP